MQVNRPPLISITSPPEGAKLIAGSIVNIEVTASDPDGQITKVEFFEGSSLLGTATTTPFRIDWIVPAPNKLALSAKAYDDKGGVGLATGFEVQSIAGTVTAAPKLRYSPTGLVVQGQVGATYRVESASSLSAPVQWTTVQEIKLSTDTLLIPGTSPSSLGTKFYRAVFVP